MFDKLKDLNNLRKVQSQMKKEMEAIVVVNEKKGVEVKVRGDKRIEEIKVSGERHKDLEDALNDTFKKVDKKVEKQMRGYMGEFGLPGF